MGFVLVRTLGFLIWFDPFSTVPISSSTQNAPGFAFFWLNRVRFSLFRCFLAAKFSPWFLCTLPHSGYKFMKKRARQGPARPCLLFQLQAVFESLAHTLGDFVISVSVLLRVNKWPGLLPVSAWIFNFLPGYNRTASGSWQHEYRRLFSGNPTFLRHTRFLPTAFG